MKHPRKLTKAQLVRIVEAVQFELYHDGTFTAVLKDGREALRDNWNPDKECNGADLVERLGELCADAGLSPD